MIQHVIHLCAALWIAGIVSLPTSAFGGGFSSSLRDRIETFVAERAEGGFESIWVPSLGDFELPGVDPGSVRVELSTRERGRLNGAVPVSVVLSDDRRVLKRGIVTARVEASRSVWVVARDLRRGDRLRDKDLRSERMDAGSVPRETTSDLDQLLGKELKRSVREGTPLRTSWVTAPSIVERGQLVRLILTREGLRIEGRGKAVTDGALGDRIRVVNTDSRREVVGRVVEDGSVHVGF